jgi:hypothetical protein
MFSVDTRDPHRLGIDAPFRSNLVVGGDNQPTDVVGWRHVRRSFARKETRRHRIYDLLPQ